MKNYYEELEVSRHASSEVINKAYKTLAKKYHPDSTKENKELAEERFKKISEAYETLSDSEKKKKYDEQLNITEPIIDINKYFELNDVNQYHSLSHCTCSYRKRQPLTIILSIQHRQHQ